MPEFSFTLSIAQTEEKPHTLYLQLQSYAIQRPSLWSWNLMITVTLCVFFVWHNFDFVMVKSVFTSKTKKKEKKWEKPHTACWCFVMKFLWDCVHLTCSVSFYLRHLNIDIKQKRKLLGYCDIDGLQDYGCSDTAAATCHSRFPFILVNALLRGHKQNNSVLSHVIISLTPSISVNLENNNNKACLPEMDKWVITQKMSEAIKCNTICSSPP